MTPERWAEDWRERLTAARTALRETVSAASQDDLVRRPLGEPSDRDERWPARDVLWHVADQEQRWCDWLEAALDGRSADVAPRAPRPAHVDGLPQLMEALASARARTLSILEQRLAALPAEARDEPRPTTTRPDRSYSYEHVLGRLEQHDRDHAEQVRALLAGEA